MLKKMLHAIPVHRLTLYLLMLGLLPFLFLFFSYTTKARKLDQLQERLTSVMQAARSKEQRQEINGCVKSNFTKADPHYLEHKIESLSFLQNEREALEKIMKKGSFPGGPAIEQRFHFLTGRENSLCFETSNALSKEKIEESLETAERPIEMDGQDLKNLLWLIEEKQEGQPQLIITDFQLNKKHVPQKNEVYEISLQVLKREFSS